MQGTATFEHLVHDPRFSLCTATVDPQVVEGDAKIWGTAEDVQDDALHRRFAEALFAETCFDLRGPTFEHFFRLDVVGASAVLVADGRLDITTWRRGAHEKIIRKH